MQENDFFLTWANAAKADFKLIFNFWLDSYSDVAAQKIKKEILDSLDRLYSMPESFPLVRQLSNNANQYRYVPTKHGYKIIFFISGNQVNILRIVHSRQNLDELFASWE